MKTSYLLSLPLFFFTACATITRGVHDKLSVLSEPSGANVMLSSGEGGVTPTKFVKSRSVPDKPGYVFSPFDTSGRYVDVSGYTSGSKVKDPWTDKIFIVP